MSEKVLTLLCVSLVFCAIFASHIPVDVSATECSENTYGPYVGTRVTCPFIEEVDIDPTRIPDVLPKAKCNCPGSLCRMKGDFRCLEVKSTFHVAYRRQVGNRWRLINGTCKLPTSCVCATSLAVRAFQTASYRTASIRLSGRTLERWLQNGLEGIGASLRELQQQLGRSHRKNHNGNSKKRDRSKKKSYKNWLRRWRKRKLFFQVARKLPYFK